MSLKNASVLVIDDDLDVLTAVRLLLKPEVKEILTEKNPEQIRHLMAKHSFDIVLLDMNFNASINTGNEGIYWLKKIREEYRSQAAVIMITAYGAIDLAIRSLKEGASDFLVKPWHNERLLATIREAYEGRKQDGAGNNTAAAQTLGNELLGSSPAMQDIFHKVRKVAPTDANILVLGENGTGKELIARAIHQHSSRAAGPFVKVDLGALTESLFESELFGHRKGAFTDAREDRKGRIEEAHRGTLFLDEIGNISLHQQAKLLSVLQNRQVIRLGTNAPIPVDIRLVCATNCPLSELANEHRFRKDLLYRINTVEVLLPPLRQRGDDIALLAGHFVRSYGSKYGKPALTLGRDAQERLRCYPFPGNVRELQYAIERAVIMAEGAQIGAEDLLFSPLESAASQETESSNLGTLEKNTILRVIEKNGGNISKAARELGITRTALYRRLSKYDL